MNLTKLLEIQMLYSDEQSKSLIVTNALIFVVENHFRQLGWYFVLTFMCRERFFCNYYNDLLDNLFLSWEPPPMQVVKILPNTTQGIPGTRDINLILVDTFESFNSIDVISYTSRYDHNEYYYIFLQNFDHLLYGEMTKIFDYCWKNYIINCNVQIQTAKGEIMVYTYYPFTPGNCGNITIKLINQFKHEKMVDSILFPKKLSNFHRCSLRAALWNVPPFIYLKEYGNGIGYVTRGAEGRLLKEISNRLNFTIIVKVPPNDEQRGSSNPNNLTGALRMLHDRTVDFSLGCFRFSADRADVATATTSYYQSALVICIPVAAYGFSSFEILLFPFSSSVWQLILAIFGFAISIVWLQRRYSCLTFKSQLKSNKGYQSNREQDHPYLNTYLMALGMSAITMPRRSFTRLLCLDWMILTLLLRTSYHAFLFHFMRTQPLRALPTTVEDLVVRNYTIVMNQNTYIGLKNVKFVSYLNLHIINSTSETISFEYANKPDRKLVAAGPSAFMLYYKYRSGKVNDFQLLNQNIYSMPITMYLTKHSYLVDEFNNMLLRFRSVGLTQAWMKQEVDFGYVSKRKMEERFFQLEDLYMLFVILVFGHTLAGIAFFIEILCGKLIS